jgi:2-polyprenyl-3-methyl-5-hydroxy-6-metoxy-1,4-benzoquinol methylase
VTAAADPGTPAASEANRLYYDSASPGRDSYWRKMAAPRFRVATLLRLVAESGADSLVDLGCGNGQLLREVAARHPRMALAGLDLSAAQVAANRQRHPEIDWAACDLARPLPADSDLAGRFGVVIAAEIIEHVAEPEALLANALRLARPGGQLLLSTQSGPVRETERRVGHVRHYTAAEMSALLEACGWRPRRAWNCGYPFHDLSKWYANRDPERTLAQFGQAEYGWKENLVCFGLRLAFRLNSNRRGAQLFAVAARP